MAMRMACPYSRVLLALCAVCLLAAHCRAAPVDVISACRCTREFNAVCANDGRTYSSKCMLNCVRAMGTSRMGQGLYMVRAGPC